MILGILSDTHGRIVTARAAIALLKRAGAEYFIHCGDVGEGVLELLPEGRSAFVFGNCDFDRGPLLAEARISDIVCMNNHGKLSFDGKPVSFTHGDEPAIVRAILETNTPGYLFTGHTHVAKDERHGDIRWINPGALQRATRKTVATLDVATDTLVYHEVEG